jgi:hypothetical protein
MNRRSINLLSGSPDPGGEDGSVAVAQANLYHLLDQWSGMEEAEWTPDRVSDLRRHIIEIFNRHAGAEQWFHIWRTENPGAKLP